MNDFFTENIVQIVNFLFLVFLIWLFGAMIMNGIDKSIQNQDRMLCESALISGNEEYLKKCECYYNGEDIKCLQK